MIQIPKIYETLAKSRSEFRASFLFIIVRQKTRNEIGAPMSKIFLLCFAHHLPSKPVVFTDDYWSWLPGSQACSTEDLLLHVPCHSTYQILSALPPRTIRATGDNFVQLVHDISEVLQLGQLKFMELSHPIFCPTVGMGH